MVVTSGSWPRRGLRWRGGRPAPRGSLRRATRLRAVCDGARGMVRRAGCDRSGVASGPSTASEERHPSAGSSRLEAFLASVHPAGWDRSQLVASAVQSPASCSLSQCGRLRRRVQGRRRADQPSEHQRDLRPRPTTAADRRLATGDDHHRLLKRQRVGSAGAGAGGPAADCGQALSRQRPPRWRPGAPAQLLPPVHRPAPSPPGFPPAVLGSSLTWAPRQSSQASAPLAGSLTSLTRLPAGASAGPSTTWSRPTVTAACCRACALAAPRAWSGGRRASAPAPGGSRPGR